MLFCMLVSAFFFYFSLIYRYLLIYSLLLNWLLFTRLSIVAYLTDKSFNKFILQSSLYHRLHSLHISVRSTKHEIQKLLVFLPFCPTVRAFNLSCYSSFEHMIYTFWYCLNQKSAKLYWIMLKAVPKLIWSYISNVCWIYWWSLWFQQHPESSLQLSQRPYSLSRNKWQISTLFCVVWEKLLISW